MGDKGNVVSGNIYIERRGGWSLGKRRWNDGMWGEEVRGAGGG